MRSLTLLKTTGARWPKSAIVGACVLLFSGAMTSFAQAPTTPQAQHAAGDAADQNNHMMEQIADLRAQVAKLQAATQQNASSKKSNAATGMNMGTGKAMNMPVMEDKGEMGAMPSKAPIPPARKKSNATPAMNMAMMDDKGEMGAMPSKAPMPSAAGGMKDDQGEMGGMSGGAQSTAPAAPAAAMGMCCMGGMGGMSGGGRAGMGGSAAQPAGGMAGMNAPSSAMPGQPGASHLYHIGSTGFFLNHPQHITLTQDQKMTLNRLKEQAMLDRASTQRRIDQEEQELYALTGADQPDTSKIQAKVAEIEKLRGDQRMNFILAVGEATKVLTYDQRLALMGTMAASKK